MILYVNGDSYATFSDGAARYSEFLAQHLKCDLVTSAIGGSSNRRIFRTSLRDLMALKQQHADIVAVISLSFPLRTELWDPELIENNKFVNDGEFVSFQTTGSKNWFANRLSPGDRPTTSKYQKYINEWLCWYNIEAETVELFREILLLTTWCKHHNIRYVIFSGPLQEPVDFDSAFIKSFYKEVSSDPNVIDICNISFTEWCINRGFSPIDHYTQEIHGKTYIIGHHGEEAHKEFAKFLFENYIEKQI